MPFIITEEYINQLKLSGADLLLYSYIHDNGWEGSMRSLGEKLNLNVHTVISSLGRLESRNLVEKNENGFCVKIDTLTGEGGNVSKLTHETSGEGGVSKMTQKGKCVKIDTERKSVSKLTQTDVCAKIDTKLKLKRKEK